MNEGGDSFDGLALFLAVDEQRVSVDKALSIVSRVGFLVSDNVLIGDNAMLSVNHAVSSLVVAFPSVLIARLNDKDSLCNEKSDFSSEMRSSFSEENGRLAAHRWAKGWIGQGGGAWIVDPWLVYAASAIMNGQRRNAVHSIDLAGNPSARSWASRRLDATPDRESWRSLPHAPTDVVSPGRFRPSPRRIGNRRRTAG